MLQPKHEVSRKPRLLICTQAVDSSDPILGFFVRWIEEMAQKSDHVIVVCLRKGTHTLPGNVEVIALGEQNRFHRALEVCTIAFGRRNEYDAVFVHMNPEYIVAAGWLWRMLNKKIVLWYTHKSVNLRLRLATFFAHAVLTASHESFRLPTKKIHVTGHGIDTDFFTPDGEVRREDMVLSVGRLTRSKRHDLAIRGATHAGRSICIIGDGPERVSLEVLAREINADATFLGSLDQARLRDQYRKASYLVHTSETGSLDKVVLEALATGLTVITTSEAFRDFPVTKVAATPEAITAALHDVRENPDRASIIKENHSLTRLIPQIMRSLTV